MQAIEFLTEINSDKSINIPENLLLTLPENKKVRVIVLVEDSENKDWQLLGREEFLNGDSEKDSIYDSL